MVCKPYTLLALGRSFLPLRYVAWPYSHSFEFMSGADQVRAALYLEDPSSLIYLAQRKRTRITPIGFTLQGRLRPRHDRPNVFLAVTGLSDDLALIVFKEFVDHQEFPFMPMATTEEDVKIINALNRDFNILREDRGEHTREILRQIIDE